MKSAALALAEREKSHPLAVLPSATARIRSGEESAGRTGKEPPTRRPAIRYGEDT